MREYNLDLVQQMVDQVVPPVGNEMPTRTFWDCLHHYLGTEFFRGFHLVGVPRSPSKVVEDVQSVLVRMFSKGILCWWSDPLTKETFLCRIEEAA